MIFVEEILISRGILESRFCCDLQVCRGSCCIEGDYGAPLEDAEIEIIEKISSRYSDKFGQESIEILADTGAVQWYEKKGIWGTPLRKDGSCIYSLQNSNGIHICLIEDLYNNGEIEFQKPISCHLYPIRINHVGEYTVLNYDEWDICDGAVRNGFELSLSVVEFCKDALIRKFGEDFYSGLLEKATDA